MYLCRIADRHQVFIDVVFFTCYSFEALTLKLFVQCHISELNLGSICKQVVSLNNPNRDISNTQVGKRLL